MLSASTGAVWARRLATLSRALALDPLPIGERVAGAWAALRIELGERRARLPVNDAWIAAAAIAPGLPVVAGDADYDLPIPEPRTIRV